MSHQTEIQIPNGKIKCQASSEVLKKTKCFKCQQEIYIVYTTTGPKIPVNIENGKMITHEMRCTHSKLYKTEKRQAEERKKYEERIIKKEGAKKIRRKKRR